MRQEVVADEEAQEDEIVQKTLQICPKPDGSGRTASLARAKDLVLVFMMTSK